jgi:hypothetical protein
MAMPRKPKRPRKGAEFRFKIDAYTPDTIPMERLSQYMAELAHLLGEPKSVHFRRVEGGSTVIVHTIEREAVPKVRERTAAVRRGEAPQEPMRAFQSLNKMLREDDGVGALQEKRRATILKFPGKLEAAEKFSAIRQYGSVDGVITSIGGRDVVHVRLESDGKQISGCETTREIAKRLRHHLYDPVRLFGRGRWSRDADGNWNLEDFRVNDFEPLEDVPLSQALAELRAIPTEWDDTAYGELREIRHGPEDKKNGGH